MRRLLRTLFWVLGVFTAWQVILRTVRKIRPFPIPWWFGVMVLESPLRKRIMPGDVLVERIGARPGQTVLEIGAGTGYVVAEVARAVGSEGRVHALDIEPEMIERLRQKTLLENLDNVEAKLGEATKLDYADETFDLVYMVTALGEIPDKRSVLWEAYRVLKPGGIVSISEWLVDPDYMRQSTVIQRCEETGFYLTEEHGNLFFYTLNFRKPARRLGNA
jgi:SAM-dependent methyltransferase